MVFETRSHRIRRQLSDLATGLLFAIMVCAMIIIPVIA